MIQSARIPTNYKFLDKLIKDYLLSSKKSTGQLQCETPPSSNIHGVHRNERDSRNKSAMSIYKKLNLTKHSSNSPDWTSLKINVSSAKKRIINKWPFTTPIKKYKQHLQILSTAEKPKETAKSLIFHNYNGSFQKRRSRADRSAVKLQKTKRNMESMEDDSYLLNQLEQRKKSMQGKYFSEEERHLMQRVGDFYRIQEKVYGYTGRKIYPGCLEEEENVECVINVSKYANKLLVNIV